MVRLPRDGEVLRPRRSKRGGELRLRGALEVNERELPISALAAEGGFEPPLVSGQSHPGGAGKPIARAAARTLARSPVCHQLHRRLQPICYLRDCSGCFRLERLPEGLALTGKRRLVTARTFDGHRRPVLDGTVGRSPVLTRSRCDGKNA